MCSQYCFTWIILFNPLDSCTACSYVTCICILPRKTMRLRQTNDLSDYTAMRAMKLNEVNSFRSLILHHCCFRAMGKRSRNQSYLCIYQFPELFLLGNNDIFFFIPNVGHRNLTLGIWEWQISLLDHREEEFSLAGSCLTSALEKQQFLETKGH